MNFYKDYNNIGARKPYDYPEDIHFNNKKFRKFAIDETDRKAYHTDSDFSELAYNDIDVYRGGSDFGGLPEMISSYRHIIFGLAIAGLAFYMYKKK
jgi:hypothetical protein